MFSNTMISDKPDKQLYYIGEVFADNNFEGARLDGFVCTSDSLYVGIIKPETIPVNNSPWYAFRVWSSSCKKIDLRLDISDGFVNRYLPKVSYDGITWHPLGSSSYTIENDTLVLHLSLTSKKLWISAQENYNEAYIASWMNLIAIDSYLSIEEYGTSVQGRKLRMLHSSSDEIKETVIIIGRQHPAEVPGGTISLMSFVNTLLEDSPLASLFREKFNLLVFPLINPDGVAGGNWRCNANGVDLNRDWVDKTQPETIYANKFIQDHSKSYNYCYGIDFHTSYSGPYLLVTDSVINTLSTPVTDRWIVDMENTLQEKFDIRPRSQALPYCYNWMINEIEVEAVTYEEKDEKNRDEIRQRAKQSAVMFMQALLEVYCE